MPSAGLGGNDTMSYLGPVAPTPCMMLRVVPSGEVNGCGQWELMPSSLWRSTCLRRQNVTPETPEGRRRDGDGEEGSLVGEG